MIEDFCPVQWAGRQAVVVLPETIGISNAGQVREELLSVINRGATTLIADMTATISCAHAGADAVIRARQRAAVRGTKLRLVVIATSVLRVLGLRGMGRLVSVMAAAFPAAASTHGTGAAPVPAGDPLPAGELLDALQDGVALADGDGTIVAASAQLEDMFGYGPGELPGLPAESLVPVGLQEAHRGHRASRAGSPSARPMGAGAQLAGLRKDGTTFPVRISLTPVATAAGQFTLAVIRDITGTGRLDDLAGLARDAAAAQQEHLRLLDTVINGLFHAALSLQTAADCPADAARLRIGAALGDLGDIIREIRNSAFTSRDHRGLTRPAPSGDDR